MPSGYYGSDPPVSDLGTEIPERETCDLCGCEVAFPRKDMSGHAAVYVCRHCKPVICILCGDVFSSQDDDGTHLCNACADDAGEGRAAS